MFHIFLIFILFLAVFAFSDWTKQDERIAQQALAVQVQEAQASILVELTALDDALINSFVDDWQRVCPKPTSANVVQLQIIAQKIKNNVPEWSAKYKEGGFYAMTGVRCESR